MADLRRLIHEVHRRSLWQVLGIYLVGSWGALQVVDLLTERVGLPEWFPGLALALLVLGLPIVLATAFVQEGIRGGEAADEKGVAPGVGGPAEPSGRAEPAGRADSAAGAVAGSAHRRFFTWRNALVGGVGAFALWGVVAAGWLLAGRGEAAGPGSGHESLPAAGVGVGASAGEADAPDRRSIAVLPFLTRAREGDQDALIFADGMHDDLLTQLSKIEALTVISRTSVMKYRDTSLGIPEIAEELGVATVLEGGVQRSGDRVRVNVQLIEAASDRHLWAETYDEELTAANVFAIQSDLAKKIAGALRATLAPDVRERIEARPTESLEAYDLYARGRYILQAGGSQTKASLDEAADLFRRAVAADSAFAQAWLGLADVQASGGGLGLYEREPAARAAREAAEHAIALDPNLAEALARHANLIAVLDLRYEEAEREIARALELNPGSATVHVHHAAILQRLGRYEEAVEASRRAVRLDPLSIPPRQQLADRLFFARDFEASIAESRKVLEMERDDAYSLYNMGWAYALLDRNAEAIAALRRAVELAPDNPGHHIALAFAYARAGDREAALERLRAAGEAAVSSSYDGAIVYHELGEVDRAFRMLEPLLKDDPAMVARFENDPSADRLREDSRYAALLERLGLDERRR